MTTRKRSKPARTPKKKPSVHYVQLDKNDVEATFDAIREMIREVDPTRSAKLEADLAAEGYHPLPPRRKPAKKKKR